MFTQPCFIRKDTPKLRKKLKDLGQRENTFDDFSGKWIAANHGMFISVSEGFQNLCKEDIDCGTNEQLFLAISSLRNDTDKNQWFTDGVNWVLCDEFKFSSYWVYNDINISLNTIHKATVEELIEYFKEE